MPLSAEHMAARKQRMAPMMKAVVRADMKGEDMALGKKLCPVKVLTALAGIAFATEPIL